jgi:membrane-associated PAP2 superfamily phosphatase
VSKLKKFIVPTIHVDITALKISLPHYLFPLFCMLAALACQYSGLDVALENLFYDNQHHSWPYQATWLTQDILHDDAHDVIVLIFIAMLLFFLATVFLAKLKHYRRTSGFILLSSLSSVILVGILKDTTHMYTPWDLQQFGGLYPNIRLFDPVMENLPVGHAFPAGHASGGYALLSFYFAARMHQYRYRIHILYAALAAGRLLGIDQQLRGAHMISHDLFTLAICWLSCLFWSAVLLPKHKPARSVTPSDSCYQH